MVMPRETGLSTIFLNRVTKAIVSDRKQIKFTYDKYSTESVTIKTVFFSYKCLNINNVFFFLRIKRLLINFNVKLWEISRYVINL